jgi:hypothetical protein
MFLGQEWILHDAPNGLARKFIRCITKGGENYSISWFLIELMANFINSTQQGFLNIAKKTGLPEHLPKRKDSSNLLLHDQRTEPSELPTITKLYLRLTNSARRCFLPPESQTDSKAK